MNKIEHIGIAVKDLQASNLLFEKLFGAPAYKEEEVASEGVKTSFFQNGPNKIELLEATNPESPIAKFIEKKGEGIHHMAFAVNDLEKALAETETNGIRLIDKEPRKGAEGLHIGFLHPKSTYGVLTELCEDKNQK